MISLSYITHTGKTSRSQEDALLIGREVIQTSMRKVRSDSLEVPCIIAVADGIGGLPYGEVASRTLLGSIADLYPLKTSTIHKLLRYAQQSLSSYAINRPKFYGMGSTIAGMIITNETIEIFNVGDSRVYEIRDSKIRQHTYDHTLLNTMIRNGELQESSVSDVGNMYKMLDSCLVAAEDGDDFEIHAMLLPRISTTFLICTDGVHDMLSDEQIHTLIDDNLNDSVQRIYDDVMKQGAKDNFSLILINIT